MHILDSQISRALIQPTPWEVQQYRRAALKDRAGWEAMIDIAGAHRFCDDVQRSVDVEIRRERLRCGGAPGVIAGSGMIPAELARNENYQARVAFTWARADSRSEASGTVTELVDKVLLESQGAAAGNARSIDSTHSYTQATPAQQVPAVATSALLDNRPVAAFTAGQWYTSKLAALPWRFQIDGSGADTFVVYVSTSSAIGVVFASLSDGSATGMQLYTGSGNATYRAANGNGNLFLASTSGAALNTPAYGEASYVEGLTPQVELFSKASLQISGPRTAAPSAASPAGSLRIGAQINGAYPGSFLFADFIAYTARSATSRTVTRRYIALRYPSLA